MGVTVKGATPCKTAGVIGRFRMSDISNYEGTFLGKF